MDLGQSNWYNRFRVTVRDRLGADQMRKGDACYQTGLAVLASYAEHRPSDHVAAAKLGLINIADEVFLKFANL